VVLEHERGNNPQVKSIRHIFDDHGLRCTRQREQIYEALAATRAHPTAEELLHSVRNSEPGLSLATVYNTLEAFTACGLARRIPCPAGAGPCRYDADTSEHVHITTPDGRVIDLPHDLSQKLLEHLPPEILDEIEDRMGLKVSGVSVQVVGVDGPRGIDRLRPPERK
jgi:Fur family transcriptional regulator, peroxide stress response regulator